MLSFPSLTRTASRIPATLISKSSPSISTSSSIGVGGIIPRYQSHSYSTLSLSKPLLGPKKKGKGDKGDGGGGGGVAAPKDPGAYHLFNIFAEKPDPIVLLRDARCKSL